ncbi:MAG TPA: ATP-binding protein [Chitinispirillaceae bacterium]|jgi:signal transduction histidine kinase|nr:ATP-binding protein [Chitinispirillaceae bacterium]
MSVKFKSIRKKLFTLVMQILLITLGVSQITTSILLIILSHNTFKEGEERIRENLLDKGRVLVANNSIALQGMVEDNAFHSINELVSSTIQKDKDVIYGIYMDAFCQPWVNVTPGAPCGLFKPLTAATDSMSRWANKIKEVSYKRITQAGPGVFEFAAPVEVMGQRMGTIRYGISTARMEKSIHELKSDFLKEVAKYTIILVVVSFLLLLYEIRVANNQARSITKPIDELAVAADRISSGNYNIPVKTSTDDEIGLLGNAFETMRETIKSYTDNLEQIVEERTVQLNNSYKEQLIQANKLVTLGTLVAGVAHEVNNPNNSILLSAGALEEMWDDIQRIIDEYVNQNGHFKVGGYTSEDMAEEMPQLISRIINNSRRIKSIVEDLKNYGRKDSGELKANLDINRIIRDSIEIIENEIKKYTANFNVDLKEGLPLVEGVHQRLEQVVVNLILNACQSLSDTNKEVFVSTEYDSAAQSIIISIQDQGCGMDKETLEKISQSFFTTKHNQGGTGLGLAVSSRIVKDHKGHLQFESEPGKGTLVRVILPAQNK